jgi:hypothetical protein
MGVDAGGVCAAPTTLEAKIAAVPPAELLQRFPESFEICFLLIVYVGSTGFV